MFNRARTGRRMLLGAMLLLASAAYGVDDLEFEIAHIEASAWRAERLQIRLFWNEDNSPRARVQIANVKLAGAGRQLENVVLDCTRVEISREAFACPEALVGLDSADLGAQRLRASLRYARSNGDLDLVLRDLRLGSGRAHVRAALREQDWRATLQLEQAPLELLIKLAAQAGAPVAEFSASAGELAGVINVRGAGARIDELTASGALQRATLNNESGSLATDQLSAKFSAALTHTSAGWRFDAKVDAHGGQGYAQPIFLDFGVHPLGLNARGSWAGERLAVEAFDWRHAGVAEVHGALALDLSRDDLLRDLNARVVHLSFPGAYTSYLQPWLLDTSFKALTTSGVVRAAQVLLVDGAPQAFDVDLQDVSFDDGAQVFALSNIEGAVHWRARGEVAPSRVQWRGGAVLGLKLGAADVHFSTRARDLHLQRPAHVPLLDGALKLQRLSVREAGAPNASVDIDAVLEPVSVQQLCVAFGWPEFGGRLAGEISQLKMRDGVVTLGTTLTAQVFAGVVKVSDLRLEDPFGKWPRLQSSIAINDLDLELVTRAFSFGRITGRLSGAVDGLKLFNWSPIAFDARLYTPADDRSRHRISQRAVQNIGSIGGGGAGVGAALSSGVMRFFDDFNYQRLGISCRLENEVCHMRGVAPAPNGGYYLVQGRGVPRIDVIGSAERVDWPRLVQQLIALTEAEGPVVR